MPGPRYHGALVFYRAAHQRIEDAAILIKNSRLTGGVYLAGYGVECILKTVILEAIDDPSRRSEIERSFRGAAGHDIERLRRQLVKESGRMIPKHVAQQLERVKTWGIELRYKASKVSRKEATAFMSGVEDVMRWAEESLSDA